MICLLVAFLLRLVFAFAVFPHLQSRWNLREDGDRYGEIAESIRAGRYTDVTRGPVYPMFVAAAGSPRVVKVLQALIDTATCALIFLLARGAWQPAMLWAVYPFAIWRVAFINKEILLTFLLASYVYVQLRALTKGELWLWLASGALLGIVNLCKPIFVVWPVMFLAVLAWQRQRLGNETVTTRQIYCRDLGMCWATLVLAMLAVITPWTLRNYSVTGGEFLLVATERGGVTTFIGNYQPTNGLWEGPGKSVWQAAVEKIASENEAASVVQLDRIYYRRAFEEMASNPLKAAELFARKFLRFWFMSAARRELLASITIQLIYLTLAAIGLWRARLWRDERLLSCAAILFVMFVHAFSYADMRFSLIVMPFVCLFAGAALAAKQPT